MTVTVEQLCQSLAELAPLSLAESWDNVGLLVGNRRARVERVMVCLTITPAVVAEALERQADLIVAHHPLPFKPLARITRDTVAGAMLWDLIRGGVAVYSAHTAWDSATDGINQQLADALGLTDVGPIQPQVLPPHSTGDSATGDSATGDSATGAGEVSESAAQMLGAGRLGRAGEGTTLKHLAKQAAAKTRATAVRLVGSPDMLVRKVALACGSGGSFLDAAARRGCNCLVTGEATFHACLEAEGRGVGLVLLGHYASERFAMEELAGRLAALHDSLSIWPSDNDRDPLVTLD
ncbi:Nif3-like dinuclear metal center hexameric protein [Roseimaritima sediminicola]|uniref:Nif3-like dinuclear metal center hexameric protein n=1 Tax=Roseimaritima sediminicola TaxID=2662066 RepID=UPI00129837F6|nr:Nif3-like dinuclear metal center hexameric protein [Roseimaritima sediminicola]